MPDWNDIFTKGGKVFLKPHPDVERLAMLFKEHGVRKILDLGCGTGRHLVYFSKRGFDMHGIDASPKALEIAKTWLKDEKLHAKLINHRMEFEFPFADDFFDAIISIQVIHHNLMKDIIFSIKEIERTLKSKGYIFITFPIWGLGSRSKTWDMKEIEKNTYLPQNGPEKDLPHHYFTIEEIREVFNSFNLNKIYVDGTDHRAILGQKIE